MDFYSLGYDHPQNFLYEIEAKELIDFYHPDIDVLTETPDGLEFVHSFEELKKCDTIYIAPTNSNYPRRLSCSPKEFLSNPPSWFTLINHWNVSVEIIRKRGTIAGFLRNYISDIIEARRKPNKR